MAQLSVNVNSPVYWAGQVVSGEIIVNNKIEINARGIRLRIVGLAEARWIEREHYHHRRDFYYGYNDRMIRYFSRINYINIYMTVWEPDERQILPAGTQNFPFNFRLPPNLPPTFQGMYGNIRFFVETYVDRPLRPDDGVVRQLLVLPQLDPRAVSLTSSEINRKFAKNTGFCCCPGGLLKARVYLPKSGFTIGEEVPISMEIKNSTSREIDRIEIRLLQNTNYTAKRESFSFYGSGIGCRFVTRPIINLSKNFKVSSHSSATFQSNIKIPSMPPTFTYCAIIKITYLLKLTVVPIGGFFNSMCCNIPIVILPSLMPHQTVSNLSLTNVKPKFDDVDVELN